MQYIPAALRSSVRAICAPWNRLVRTKGGRERSRKYRLFRCAFWVSVCVCVCRVWMCDSQPTGQPTWVTLLWSFSLATFLDRTWYLGRTLGQRRQMYHFFWILCSATATKLSLSAHLQPKPSHLLESRLSNIQWMQTSSCGQESNGKFPIRHLLRWNWNSEVAAHTMLPPSQSQTTQDEG